MSEKIADALHDEYGKWLAEAAVAGAHDLDRPISVRSAYRLIADAFLDLSKRIDSHNCEPPPEPGGEESTEDKPF